MPDRAWQIIEGDALEVLATLPEASVQTCVTSPPYWGLRDYGTAEWEGGDPDCVHVGVDARTVSGGDGKQYTNTGSNRVYSGDCACGAHRIDRQLGLEPTPEQYVAKMVDVFRAVRRVLRDDGTCWLNLGSSYFGGRGGGGSYSSERPGWTGGADGSDPIPSLRPSRAPACGTDGTALQDSTASGSACSDLCDECLADYAIHRAHIAGSDQPISRSEPQPSPTGRGSEPSGSASTSPDASPPGAQESTTLRSWLRHRGACSRCDSRASASSLFGSRSSADGALAFSRMTWGEYSTRLKQKDMVPIPWMVAMALQSDGWYLRSDIIWSKPNPMPESVADRPTKAHEYVFLLAKSGRYYYDAEAIKTTTKQPGAIAGTGPKSLSRGQAKGRNVNPSGNAVDGGFVVNPAFSNRRSVWTIPTQPFSAAHFAVFPPALVEPCILAGAPEGGLVLDPFAGSGTVGVVCRKHRRRFVGIELNPAYAQMARGRLGEDVTEEAAAEGNLPLFKEERSAESR